VYVSVTEARLRAVRSAVSRLALAAADLEAAARTLPRLVSPLHNGGAAEAELDGRRAAHGTHAPNRRSRRGRLRWRARRLGRVVRHGSAKPGTPVRLRSARFADMTDPAPRG